MFLVLPDRTEFGPVRASLRLPLAMPLTIIAGV